MNAALEFPALDAMEARDAKPAVPVKAQALTIKDAAIAHIRAREPEIRALAERYRAVALDLSTPKGLAAGKAARLDLRENGRLALQRGRDATKDLLNEAKADVVAEADRLIAIVKPIEDHVHGQIEARETVIAVEKAEREQKERERIAAHEAGITKMRGYVALAAGKTAAQIAGGIEVLDQWVGDWDEYQDRAARAKAETLEALRCLHAEAVQREQEAAELERQRAEQARIAAEQKAEAERLARVAADLNRQQDALNAANEEAAAVRADALAAQQEADRPAPPIIEERTESALTADARSVPATGAEAAQVPGIGDEGKAAHAEERAANPVATINAGQIGARLGFTLTVAFIEETLGVLPASIDTKRKTALWTEAQWGDICAALVGHIQGLPQ